MSYDLKLDCFNKRSAVLSVKKQELEKKNKIIAHIPVSVLIPVLIFMPAVLISLLYQF